MTRYLGKSINLFLLVLLIISVVSLVGVTSYFSQRYERISIDNSNISMDLTMRTNELAAARNQLTEIKGTLNQTSIDVEKYDELYTEKVDELDSTKSSLTNERDENKKLKSELLSMTDQLADVTEENQGLVIDIDNCKDERDDYERRANSLNSDVAKLCNICDTKYNTLSAAHQEYCDDICE